jgi:hypothetical protein
MGGAFLELSYYKVYLGFFKVCCAVMEHCSCLAVGPMVDLGWWGVGGVEIGRKTPKNRVNVTRKGVVNPDQKGVYAQWRQP